MSSSQGSDVVLSRLKDTFCLSYRVTTKSLYNDDITEIAWNH